MSYRYEEDYYFSEQVIFVELAGVSGIRSSQYLSPTPFPKDCAVYPELCAV